MIYGGQPKAIYVNCGKLLPILDRNSDGAGALMLVNFSIQTHNHRLDQYHKHEKSAKTKNKNKKRQRREKEKHNET